MIKISITGHGGHCCEAWAEGGGSIYFAVGYSIEDAIGRLVKEHPEYFGVEIEVDHSVSTTAYERDLMDNYTGTNDE